MSIGIGIGIGIIEAACQGGLSLAALRARFVAEGMSALYLPYAADAAYPLYYGDSAQTAVGQVAGLIIDQLPTERLGVERFDIASAANVSSNVTVNASVGELIHLNTDRGTADFIGPVGTAFGWAVGDIVQVSFATLLLIVGDAGYSSESCFGSEASAARLISAASRTTMRFLRVTNTSATLRVVFGFDTSAGAVISGNSVRLLNGRHLRQINESPRPSLAQSGAGVMYYNFPTGTSISPTVSIGSAGAGAMLVAVPGGAPQWYTGLTITPTFAISSTHAASGAAAIALFSAYPDAATRSWLESIFTKIGMGVRI